MFSMPTISMFYGIIVSMFFEIQEKHYLLLAAVVVRVKMVAKTPCFIIGALPQTLHSP